MGTGKSALVRHVCQLIQERAILEGGCVYVECRGVISLDSMLEKTLKSIRGDKSGAFKTHRE